MSEAPTLSLNSKLSPEVQNKLRQLVGKPDTTKSELPKTDNTNVKASNNNTNKPYKPKLNQNESEKKHKAIGLHKQQKEQAITFYKQHFSYFSKLYTNCFNEGSINILLKRLFFGIILLFRQTIAVLSLTDYRKFL